MYKCNLEFQTMLIILLPQNFINIQQPKKNICNYFALFYCKRKEFLLYPRNFGIPGFYT